MHDEKAIDAPYTWDDVMLPAKENLDSYKIITENFMYDHQKINVDLSDIDVEKATLDPLAHEEEIMRKWTSMEDARQVISQLNEYSEIADLSMPEAAIDINILQIEKIARIYRLYALLMFKKSGNADGIRELSKIHSVARKALPYARYLIYKTIWIAIAERNIKTVYDIACRSNPDSDILKEIYRGFTLLSKAEVSYRNAFITEYFYMKETADNNPDVLNEPADEFCSSMLTQGLCETPFDRQYMHLIFLITFKPNMTQNNINRKLDFFIKGTSRHPPEFDTAAISKLEKPMFKNSGGWILSSYSIAEFIFYPIRAANVKVMSDILAIYVYEKNGNNFMMSDYYTGTPYLETSTPFLYKSPGYDRTLNTDDDVFFAPPKSI